MGRNRGLSPIVVGLSPIVGVPCCGGLAGDFAGLLAEN